MQLQLKSNSLNEVVNSRMDFPLFQTNQKIIESSVDGNSVRDRTILKGESASDNGASAHRELFDFMPAPCFFSYQT